jgi:hypothetical protein
MENSSVQMLEKLFLPIGTDFFSYYQHLAGKL